MSITREKNDNTEQQNKEWDLDQYPDIADWSKLKKKDLIDMLEDDIFGLYGILSICDVIILEDDPQIKTACVTLTASPKIFINRKFLNKFCATPYQLLMILMHELYHKIFNHASLFRTSKEEDKPYLNVATDAFINALLYQLYPEEKYATFFRSFYDQLIDERKKEDPSFKGHPFHLLKSRSNISEFRIRMFYEQLYSPFGQDIDSIIQIVKETCPAKHVQYVKGIGDHSGQGGAVHEHLRKEISKIAKRAQKTLNDQAEEYNRMLEARKKAEEERKKAEEEAKGKGKGNKTGKDKEKGKDGKGFDGDFDPDEREKTQSFCPESTAFCRYVGSVVEYFNKKDQNLQSSMIKMAKQSIESKIIIKTKNMFPSIPGMTVQPNFKDKGALVARHLGKYKPFYKNKLLPQDFGLCHVYIDVSGSMGHYIENIYTVLSSRTLHALLWPKIHLFSTHVEDITKKQLKEKVIDSSFGTDFDLIFEHMDKNNVKKALIFTDGYGAINQSSLDIIKKKKIRIVSVFTPDRSPSNPFVPISETSFTFNDKMAVDKDNMEEEIKSGKGKSKYGW